MLRHQLHCLRRQLLAAEAAPAAAGGLLLSLQQLVLQPQQPADAPRLYSTARRQARPAAAAGPVGGGYAVVGLDDDDEPAPELRMPDLSTIAALNPQLRDIILQHQSLQKSASAVDVMLAAVEASTPEAKRVQRLTKTGLSRLRVDVLRGLLEQLGADSRGTKDGLVQRLMDIAGAEERARLAERHSGEAAEAAAAAQFADGAPAEGVVSRRQLAAQQQVAQRLAAAASRGGSYGVPESSLRQSHIDMVQQQQSPYSSVFGPQEVADILADARADDIAIIDVRGRCPFTDWMVLATARSQRLARMLAGAVLHSLKARAREVAPGVSPMIEGALDDSPWLVVDAGSVVAHVFQEGFRQEYDLEGLWGGPEGRHVTRVQPKATVHTLDTLQEG